VNPTAVKIQWVVASCYHMLVSHQTYSCEKMLSSIKNYKGLVQLKMDLMSYMKQNCSTALMYLCLRLKYFLVYCNICCKMPHTAFNILNNVKKRWIHNHSKSLTFVIK